MSSLPVTWAADNSTIRHLQASPLRVCLVYMNPETAGDADFLTNKEYGRPRKRKKHSIPAALVGMPGSALIFWHPDCRLQLNNQSAQVCMACTSQLLPDPLHVLPILTLFFAPKPCPG